MSPQPAKVYTGTFARPLDEKDRITIPSEWRYGRDGEIAYVAMPSPNGYVAILPPTEVDEFLKKLRAAAEGDESGQDLVATLMGASQTLWFDKAGRMAVSPKLLEDAGITPKAKSGAVLVGAGFKFHVYSEKLWKTVQARTTAARQAETMRRLAV